MTDSVKPSGNRRCILYGIVEDHAVPLTLVGVSHGILLSKILVHLMSNTCPMGPIFQFFHKIFSLASHPLSSPLSLPSETKAEISDVYGSWSSLHQDLGFSRPAGDRVFDGCRDVDAEEGRRRCAGGQASCCGACRAWRQ
ncbi:hypothetical protein BT93_K0357 [Corymbia citriodora subsp. variegata]|nr:hypothetical protein BT93_K0357 [Corymbia citriodora subsp. variegata]